MKKSILIILGALILMIAVGGFIFIKCHNDKEGEDDLSSADKDIIVVTEAYPTTFVIYGDDIEFDEKINRKIISEITEESLYNSDGYTYLIVNDLDNKAHLTKEDIHVIDKFLDNEHNNFVYLGTESLERMLSEGLFGENENVYEPDDLAVGVYHEAGNRIVTAGMYKKGAEYNLAEILLHMHSYALKM